MTTNLNRETRQLEINKLARTLKNASMVNGTNYEDLRNKLVQLVLEDKSLQSCVGYKVNNAMVEDNPKFQKFDDVVFAEAFAYAEKTYGKLDGATNEVIPFMKLFNYAWNLKQGDIYLAKNQEKSGFNRGRKKYLMDSFLTECCKRQELSRTERFNVLQLDKVEKWLLDNGFGEKELDRAHTIMEGCYVVNDEVAAIEEEQSGYRLSDSVSFVEQGCSERALEGIVAMAEKAFKAAGVKNFKKMRYALTFEYVYGESTLDSVANMYMEGIYDPELADFIRQNNYPEDKATTLADYLGLKRETARKALREMQKIIGEINTGRNTIEKINTNCAERHSQEASLGCLFGFCS